MTEARDRVVLIIEDDPDVARLMQLMLAWVVTKVAVATDPFVGIEMARGTRPDLILCDISMPGMNGFDLRRELAADPELAEIPFVFVSSHARVDSQLTGLRLGATAYLTKPIRRETLVATVLHQLERRQAQLDARAAAAAPENEVQPIQDAPSAGHLSGRLDTIGITDLLQLLESSRGSGLLNIRDGRTSGEMTFSTGRLIAARAGALAGEDAALRILWMTDGTFHFQKRPVAPREDGGGWSIARLLVDAAWLQDELARLGSSAPRPTDAVVIIDAKRTQELFAGIASTPWPSWEELERSHQVIAIEALAASLGTSVHRSRALLGAASEQGAVRVIPMEGEDRIGPIGQIGLLGSVKPKLR